MAVTIKNYLALYSEGNELDLGEVNKKAAEGWELLQFQVVKGPDAPQAKFIYVMQRSAGQSATDVYVGALNVTVSDNRFQLSDHGLLNDDLVRFVLGPETGNILPTPLIEGIYYFVVGSRINDFQVSLISGGAIIDITDQGVGATNEIWKKV